MSDDEDSAPQVKKQRITFGSLETIERERLEAASSSASADKNGQDADEEGDEEPGVSAAVLAGIRAGNINISDGKKLRGNIYLKVFA